MSDEKSKIQIAVEAAEIRAAELTTSTGKRVRFIVLEDGKNEGDVAIAYLKEPSREAKMAVMDQVMTSPSKAGELYLTATLMKEESDPRFSSMSSEHDAIFIGGCYACIPMVEVYRDALKKK